MKATQPVRTGTKLVACVALLVSALFGCGAPDCAPDPEEGDRFKVSVLAESPDSGQCGLIKLVPGMSYEVEAGVLGPVSPDCESRAAAGPPVQDPALTDCTGSGFGELGVACTITYPDGCRGQWTADFRDLILPRGSGENQYRVGDWPHSGCTTRTYCLDKYDVFVEAIPE